MESRIEGFSGLEDTERDMNQLAHHGADNQLGRFAIRREAFAEALAPIRFVKGDHRRHVEGAAQEGMADLGQARFAPHAAAGLVVLRIEGRRAG
jgi:hypothetical protein